MIGGVGSAYTCEGVDMDREGQKDMRQVGDMEGGRGQEKRRYLGSDHDHLPVWPGGMRGRGSSRSRSRTLHYRIETEVEEDGQNLC